MRALHRRLAVLEDTVMPPNAQRWPMLGLLVDYGYRCKAGRFYEAGMIDQLNELFQWLAESNSWGGPRDLTPAQLAWGANEVGLQVPQWREDDWYLPADPTPDRTLRYIRTFFEYKMTFTPKGKVAPVGKWADHPLVSYTVEYLNDKPHDKPVVLLFPAEAQEVLQRLASGEMKAEMLAGPTRIEVYARNPQSRDDRAAYLGKYATIAIKQFCIQTGTPEPTNKAEVQAMIQGWLNSEPA